MSKRSDLSGMKSGRLSAIKQLCKTDNVWLFRCDCGTFLKRPARIFIISGKKGESCCLQCKAEICRENGKRNNQGKCSISHTRLYDVHRQMLLRCYESTNADYPNYGGRGISVCDDWHNTRKFIDWAESSGYRQGLTIERVNVNGNYQPDNCTWIVNAAQARNTRRVVYLTVDGETRPIVEWAEIVCIGQRTLKMRLRLGWTPKDIITIKPVKGRNQYSGL